VFKLSSRVLGVATALTLSAAILAPSASAGLLGSGGDGDGLTDSLPLSGNLLAPVGDLLGSSVGVSNLLGLDGFLNPEMLGGLTGGLTGGLLGGDLLGGGLPVVGDVTGLLGGDLLGGGLPVVGALGGGDLLGGGLPLVGDGAGGELLDGALEVVGATTLACDAAIPQVLQSFLGDVGGILCEFNVFDSGVSGLLGSL
jgi:hypothetical protein